MVDYVYCLCRYAKLEKGLGEVDRARGIYIHASAMADPRRDTAFWADWNAFEVALFPTSSSYFSPLLLLFLIALSLCFSSLFLSS